MKEKALTAVYYPINCNWPAMLRARLICAILPAKPERVGWVWTAKDAGNGDKSTAISSSMMTPPRVYTTRAAAVKAAKRIGWIVGNIDRNIAKEKEAENE